MWGGGREMLEQNPSWVYILGVLYARKEGLIFLLEDKPKFFTLKLGLFFHVPHIGL